MNLARNAGPALIAQVELLRFLTRGSPFFPREFAGEAPSAPRDGEGGKSMPGVDSTPFPHSMRAAHDEFRALRLKRAGEA